MALNIDTRTALRTVDELRALIAAVRDGTATDETDAVEWKGSIDNIASKAWMFQVVRHVLGMANRSPLRALQAFEGCGYLLMGVEPGRLPGVDAVDLADVENKMRPYLAAGGPRWSWWNIAVGSANVAVVTVEAPRWGDPIHTLQSGFLSFEPGAIFIRRQGQTERANAGEVAVLVERAKRAAERLDVSVEWVDAVPPMPTVADAVDEVTAWVKVEATSMLRRAEEVAAGESRDHPVSAFGIPTAALQIVGGSFLEEEKRTLDEYKIEVANWASKTAEAAAPCARDLIARLDDRPRLRPQVINNTERNFAKVCVKLNVARDVSAVLPDRRGRDRPLMPSRPRPFGPSARSFFPNMPSISADDLLPPPAETIWVDNSHSARVTFALFDLRPHHIYRLSSFWLVGGGSLAGQEFTISWHATASNVDGLVQGTLEAHFEPTAIPIGQALNQY